MGEHDEAAPAGCSSPRPHEDVPDVPDIRSYELYPGSPYVLAKDGDWKVSVGWQELPPRKGGASFLVAQRGRLGVAKVIERFPLTPEGWAGAWRALVKLDAASARRVRAALDARAAERSGSEPGPGLDWLRERKQRVREEKQAAQAEKMKAFNDACERHKSATHLRALGVAVCAGEVYREAPFSLSARLGSLAGARAEVTGGTSGHRRSGGVRALDAATAAAVVGPVGLLAGASRKAVRGTAFVIFADGAIHETAIPDQVTLVRAQADAVRFNALAAASAPAPAVDAGDPAAKLRKLQELRDEGLLSEEEFQAKRAGIIDSI